MFFEEQRNLGHFWNFERKWLRKWMRLQTIKKHVKTFKEDLPTRQKLCHTTSNGVYFDHLAEFHCWFSWHCLTTSKMYAYFPSFIQNDQQVFLWHLCIRCSCVFSIKNNFILSRIKWCGDGENKCEGHVQFIFKKMLAIHFSRIKNWIKKKEKQKKEADIFIFKFLSPNNCQDILQKPGQMLPKFLM